MGRKGDVLNKIDRMGEMVECLDGRKAERCSYANMLGRCSFPGTMAAVHGGEWYCRFHYKQLNQGVSEQETAEAIVLAKKETDVKSWQDEAIDAKILEMKDDPLMQMAQRLAQGECSRDDASDFLGLLRQRVTGVGQKLPYEKSQRNRGASGKSAFDDLEETSERSVNAFTFRNKQPSPYNI